VVKGLKLLFTNIFWNRALIVFRIVFHKYGIRFRNRFTMYCEKKIQAVTTMKITISNARGCARQRNATVKPFHMRPLISKILENGRGIRHNLKKNCEVMRATHHSKCSNRCRLSCRVRIVYRIGGASINVILRPKCFIICSWIWFTISQWDEYMIAHYNQD